jgi:hypothetical protein
LIESTIWVGMLAMELEMDFRVHENAAPLKLEKLLREEHDGAPLPRS